MKSKNRMLFGILLLALYGCGGGGGGNAPAITPLSSEKAITSYSINSVDGAIDEGAKTITVALPFGTNLNGLIATFTTSGESVEIEGTPQESGVTANDFTNSVVYTVFAEDSSTANYTVTVNAGVKLTKTGQTVCYNASGNVIDCSGTGQDGDLQKGVAWPNPRFTVGTGAEADCVTDNLTGLMWAKNATNLPGEKLTWQGSLDYVETMNSGSGLCGHIDWRLPNVKELRSLFNFGQAETASWLNTQGFINVQADWYWSSTTSTGYVPHRAYIGYMARGHLAIDDKTNSNYAWPTRGGRAGVVELPKTGQTVCYNASGNVIDCSGTGQDGDLQKGVAWPNPRFTVGTGAEADCVIDNLTGLIWAKDGNLGGTRNWQESLDYVAAMNSGGGLCGHTDWRLPNINELESLKHDGELTTGSWLNTQGFISVQDDWYWSSTTDAYSNNAAWFFSTRGDHRNFLGDKANIIYMWPVRDGQ
ncbi:MAG: DUF1566 domain-containing protein [Syntrophaceae bacterium]|nr:DUF1566 domain-containing protein [Syntrophaceae bacterium]